MRTNPAAKITPDATSNGIRSDCGTNSAAKTGMKEHAMTISHRSVFGDAVGPRLIFSGIIRLRPPRNTLSRSSFVVVSFVGTRGGVRPWTQARYAMSEQGGAVASYGLPSPHAAHGERRGIGATDEP